MKDNTWGHVRAGDAHSELPKTLFGSFAQHSASSMCDNAAAAAELLAPGDGVTGGSLT